MKVTAIIRPGCHHREK